MEQELLTTALGLAVPWRVARSEFDMEAARLDPDLEYPRGARFACPEPGVLSWHARCTTPTPRRGGIWISSSTRPICMRRCPGFAARSTVCGRRRW